jgi:hypothetical protein
VIGGGTQLNTSNLKPRISKLLGHWDLALNYIDLLVTCCFIGTIEPQRTLQETEKEERNSSFQCYRIGERLDSSAIARFWIGDLRLK